MAPIHGKPLTDLARTEHLGRLPAVGSERWREHVDAVKASARGEPPDWVSESCDIVAAQSAVGHMLVTPSKIHLRPGS